MVIKFTEDQRLNAVKLYQEGKTVSEVENLTGISANYVKNLLKKYGVAARPSGFQEGNSSRSGKPHSSETKTKISLKHKLSGHKSTKAAADKGRPKRWIKHKKDPVANLIRSYKAGAETRNLSFDLSRKNFESLIGQNCYYCGALPSERTINTNCKLVCNGIDRTDNSLGYSVENCVPACKVCNVMKSSMSRQKFLDHCLQIAANFVSGIVKSVNE